MNAVLRIMFPACIEDYDLSQVQSVREGGFTAENQQGQWRFSADRPIICNGTSVQSGPLKPGDILVLDQAARIAAIVFEKAAENPRSADPNPGLTLGRDAGNSIQLKDSMISARHCRVYVQNGQLRVQDLGSRNGTYINNTRISDAPLRKGDILKLGRYQLSAEKGLTVCNADAGVIFHVPLLASSPQRPVSQRPVSQRPKPALPLAPLPAMTVYPWFSRSPRLIQPPPSGIMEIEAAPSIGSKPEINWLTVLLPSLGATAATMLVSLLMALSPASLAFSVPLMLIGVLVTILNYRSQVKKYTQTETLRRQKYEAYIENCRRELTAAADSQRAAALSLNPPPEQCLAMVEQTDRRLWGRSPSDEDFLALRAGLGTAPFCLEVRTPKVGFMLEEDTFTRTPQKLAEQFAAVDGIPVLCDLKNSPSLGLTGSRPAVISMARSLMLQAAVHHSYDEVKLVLLFPENEQQEWRWARWLPHVHNETRTQRYLASTAYTAGQMLAPIEEELKRRAAAGRTQGLSVTAPLPHYLFIIADPSLLNGQPVSQYLLQGDPKLGVSFILTAGHLGQLPQGVEQILDADRGELYLQKLAGERRSFRPDSFTLAQCERLARRMAPIRLPERDTAQLLPEAVSFLEGYRVRRPNQLDLDDFWANSCNYKSMSVPIGVRANGENFYFDIHEKAHGPHGLVAGMTGSGKSEMVQSWILSMAVQFSPQDVSFVLIDFKGTGLILPFLGLPHLAGTISDLDTNISRNLIALKSELQRRKALFDRAGVSSITAYLKLFKAGQVSEPLSYLFVVIDEYAEFKDSFPEFTAEVNSLFRTGRSMGVHIILLTQNPAGVVSSESEVNIRFRWCLKVSDTAASKAVLGTHDEAAYIKNPGRAYVRVGTDEVFEPIQSFYSGAAYQPGRSEKRDAEPAVAAVALNGSRTLPPKAETRQAAQGLEIDAVVSYIRDYTARHHLPAARRIWQDRMPAKILLTDILHDEQPARPGELEPVIGMLDDPAVQSQRPFRLPLSSDGHAAIFGAPGTGKTTLLQTLIVSACQQYGPDELNLYIFDFNTRSMGMFRDYPQVASAAMDNEQEKVEKIAQTLEKELEERKKRFSEEGVGTLRAYRRASGENLPYIVLIVDKFNSVYQLYPQLEDFFIRIGSEGGSYGILLVLTASSSSPAVLGYKLTPNIRTLLALQMADSADYSAIVGRTEGLLPEKLPGRGLFKEKRVLEFQTALPTSGDEGSFAAEIAALGEKLTERFGEKRLKAVEVLPEIVELDKIPAGEGPVLGIFADDLSPAVIPADAPHYLLISGLPKSGKTTLLRAILRQQQKAPFARTAIFGDPADYASLNSKPEFLQTGAEADDFLQRLGDELETRQQSYEAGERDFTPIHLLVDGYRRFFEAISEQSVARLTALLLSGGGLGVTFTAAGSADELAALTAYAEPLTMMLAEGPSVLLGGNALQHLAIETDLPPVMKNQLLPPWEGWYRPFGSSPENLPRRFKAAYTL